MRKEVEVSFKSMNGSIFRGTITPQEVWHMICEECLLDFKDFNNFQEARNGLLSFSVSSML
jgi:hypothetical protein